MSKPPTIITAADCNYRHEYTTLLRKLHPDLTMIKVGMELFTTLGPDAIGLARHQGYEVMLDLKYHDIPATVHQAVAVASSFGCKYITVHASGGTDMMTAAVHGTKPWPYSNVVAVTALTSMDQADLASIGIYSSVPEYVEYLTYNAEVALVRHIVCSPLEVKRMKKILPHFTYITPGVRLGPVKGDDQKRYLTPREAINEGSDHLVIGRPITQADDPRAALELIVETLK